MCLRSDWREDHDRIEAMAPDGSLSVVLLELGELRGLSVSPDGRQVAIGWEGYPEIGLYIAEGGRPVSHLSWDWRPPVGCSQPRWTPDGNTLICGGWAADADGSNLRLLTREVGTGFDLEGRLVTSHFYDRSGRFHEELSAIDVESGEVTELDLPDSARIELLALRPVCSRDGSKVAFHRAGDIWARDEEGEESNLTQGRLADVVPLFWTAAGNAVVCRSPKGYVWEVPLDPDGVPRLLTRRAVPEQTIGDERITTVWTAVPFDEWLPDIQTDQPATVRVTSEPSGADVFVDGHYKGVTPVTVQIASADDVPRRYIVSLVKDDLRTIARHVFACRGQSQEIHTELTEPLTDPSWPDDLAHVRNLVRKAIVHKSPQLLLNVAAPDGIRCPLFLGVTDDFDPIISSQRFPTPDSRSLLFGAFRDYFLLHPNLAYDQSNSADIDQWVMEQTQMGWWVADGGAEGVPWLAIEKRGDRWCVTEFCQPW